ncbi:hypothetical protein HYDPIDRAFT_30690 [Hydnomerulius pinastri MD-312]|uniref:Uncharacterized protein n=1 Tax=Hydnomerulius pinastri MD-312 TaxID=994086 RepID=A0A0C9WD30_9AGAM|nr:hypothetical protein HYDPIDRAFT_30690 [Hydnomerulius pinastri MD-312]
MSTLSCSTVYDDLGHNNVETSVESLQGQIGCLSEEITLLTVQSAILHERRRIIRERQSIQPLVMSFLVVQRSFLEMEDSPVEGGYLYDDTYQEGEKSRFSHSLPPSPAVNFLPTNYGDAQKEVEVYRLQTYLDQTTTIQVLAPPTSQEVYCSF